MWCADAPNCGRPFFAFDLGEVSCPYCGEIARHATDGTDLAVVWDVADAVDEEMVRR